MSLSWNDTLLAEIRDAVLHGLATAAVAVLAPELQQALRAAESPPRSAPGEPPRLEASGPPAGHVALADSVMVWPVPSQGMVVIGSLEPKALALELGTATTAPRPVWLNTVLGVSTQLAQAVEEEAAQALRDGNALRLPEGVNINPAAVETPSIPTRQPGGGTGLGGPLR